MSQLESPKLFVLIRSDMPLAYQGIQGGHAVAQFMIHHPNEWKNTTLVYLNVDDEEALGNMCDRLMFRGFPVAYFFEPDMGNQMTALATTANIGQFSKLKLMGGA